MSRIYTLNWDYSHSEELERDAFHIPFENSDKSSTIFLNPKYKDKLPSKVMFNANFKLIPSIDYPLTDLNIPVFSNKMISLINQIGDFDAIFTNVIMIDNRFTENIYDEKGRLKSEIPINSDYKAITLVNREKCFDFENSIYLPSELNPNKPGFIKKLVLKYSSSLPPIFRVKEAPSKLLVIQNVKEILEANDINGCVFEEVETTNLA